MRVDVLVSETQDKYKDASLKNEQAEKVILGAGMELYHTTVRLL